eukprot:3112572-Rhodomonas_salina.1
MACPAVLAVDTHPRLNKNSQRDPRTQEPLNSCTLHPQRPHQSGLRSQPEERNSVVDAALDAAVLVVEVRLERQSAARRAQRRGFRGLQDDDDDEEEEEEEEEDDEEEDDDDDYDDDDDDGDERRAFSVAGYQVAKAIP